MPRALALVANNLAADMARSTFDHDGIAPRDVTLISGRRLTQDWLRACGRFLQFERTASLAFLGQVNTLGFYLRAVPTLKRALKDPELTDIYIVNIENILMIHALRLAERHPGVRLTVLAEGNMNFQPMSPRNRTWWRWLMRPLAARLFGLAYRAPTTHLSGAFEPRVDRVVSYSARHLQAPAQKVLVLPIAPVDAEVVPAADTVLVLATALNYFMTAADYRRFKAAFSRWIKTLGAKRVLIKLHPNYDTAGIEHAIDGAEIYDEARAIEAVASRIPAARVVGFWTTGLMTLRQIRPDLECIDFGHDFYTKAAYHGDPSIKTVLEASGVTMVAAAPFLERPGR